MSTSKNTSKNRKLLDEVRDVMRLQHYSIHTERTYCAWIKRYIRYHNMTGRKDLIDGEAKIEAFLTHLAVDKAVAPSTQNQAINALVFLYKHVLKQTLDQEINAVRASRKINIPVVMTMEEVGTDMGAVLHIYTFMGILIFPSRSPRNTDWVTAAGDILSLLAKEAIVTPNSLAAQ